MICSLPKSQRCCWPQVTALYWLQGNPCMHSNGGHEIQQDCSITQQKVSAQTCTLVPSLAACSWWHAVLRLTMCLCLLAGQLVQGRHIHSSLLCWQAVGSSGAALTFLIASITQVLLQIASITIAVLLHLEEVVLFMDPRLPLIPELGFKRTFS